MVQHARRSDQISAFFWGEAEIDLMIEQPEASFQDPAGDPLMPASQNHLHLPSASQATSGCHNKHRLFVGLAPEIQGPD